MVQLSFQQCIHYFTYETIKNKNNRVNILFGVISNFRDLSLICNYGPTAHRLISKGRYIQKIIIQIYNLQTKIVVI